MKKLWGWFKSKMSCETVPFATVMGILIPVTADTLAQTAISTINTAMVSSSGPGIMSAVSLSGSLNCAFQCVFTSFCSGGEVLVAQYVGKGDKNKLRKAIGSSFFISALISVLCGVVIIAFARPLFGLLYGGLEDRSIFENGVYYLIGLAASYPLFAAYQNAAAVLRGMGDGKSTLTMSLASSITALALSYLLLHVLKMGILGLIIQTAISRAVPFFVGLWYLKRRHPDVEVKPHDVLRCEKTETRLISRVAVPFAIENLLFSGGGIAMSSMLVMVSDAAVEAHAIANSLCFFTAFATAAEIGVVPIVGMCVGAGRYKEARTMTNRCIILSTAVIGAVLILYLPFLGFVIPLFKPSEGAMEYIYNLVMIKAFFFLLLGSANNVGAAGVRASGDAKYATAVAFISMWGVNILSEYIFGIRLGYGIYAMYFAGFAEWLVRTVCFTYRRYSKKWCRHHLV